MEILFETRDAKTMRIKKSKFKQLIQEEYQKLLFEQEVFPDWGKLDLTRGIGKTPGVAGPGSPGFKDVKDIGAGLSSGFFDKPSEIKDYPRLKQQQLTPEQQELLDRLNIPYERAPESEAEMGRRTKLDKPKPKPPITNIFKNTAFDEGIAYEYTELERPGQERIDTIADMYVDIFKIHPLFDYNSNMIPWDSNLENNLKAMQRDDWRTTKDFVLPYYDKRYTKKGQNLRKIRDGQFDIHDTPIRLMTVEQAKKDPNVHQYTRKEELRLRKWVRKKLIRRILKNWREEGI